MMDVDTTERMRVARELIARNLQTASSTKTYLGKPTILGSPSTSTKKDRSKKKRERQNRKKGRK